jgi:hypothetical protein
MPYYDDPSGETRWNGPNLFYDGFEPPGESKKPMSQVVAGISGKSDAQVVEIATTIHTDLTDNPYVEDPNPTLVALVALITAADAAINDYNATKTLLALKKQVRDDAIAALKAALMTEAATVQTATGGDKVKILSTGFKVKATPSPIGVPDQVVDLKVTSGADEGVLKAVWKPVRGAMSYEIESSPDPITPTSWVSKGTVTKAQASVNSFTSGQRISLRVRAVGSAGPGAWSDAGSKIVP